MLFGIKIVRNIITQHEALELLSRESFAKILQKPRGAMTLYPQIGPKFIQSALLVE